MTSSRARSAAASRYPDEPAHDEQAAFRSHGLQPVELALRIAVLDEDVGATMLADRLEPFGVVNACVGTRLLSETDWVRIWDAG
jgi:hypothetical protein